jgi:predicted nucleotidyltransferase
MIERDMAEKNLILKVQVGSHLYGTNTETSDKDYIGVFIPEKDYVLGMLKCEQVELNTNPSSSGRRNTKEDTDCTLYSLPKFIHLASQNNPNVLEVLFAPKQNIIFCNKFGARLLEAAPFFVSKRVNHTFLGFAISQKKKLIHREYVGERKALVEKYGYDVKFAYHLIRLLLEGCELLQTHKLTLPLPDAELLTAIKTGQLKQEHILQGAEELEKLFEKVYNESTLQQTANFEELNKLQITMIQDHWKCSNYSFITSVRKFLGL